MALFTPNNAASTLALELPNESVDPQGSSEHCTFFSNIHLNVITYIVYPLF